MGSRRLLKTVVASGSYRSGATRLIGGLTGRSHTPLVIGCHRVVEDFNAAAAGYIPPMLISSTTLTAHLESIGRRRDFAGLDDVVADARHGSRPLAALTFDDGYRDVYEHAFPLLKRKGIPFTVFVVTDLLGSRQMQLHDELFLLLRHALKIWGGRSRAGLRGVLLGLGAPPIPLAADRGAVDPFRLTRTLLHSLPQYYLRRLVEVLSERIALPASEIEGLLPMTWEMVEEMHAAGVTIGSHTRTHALLPNETGDTVLSEVSGARQELERRLGTRVTHFAYPDGGFNRDVVESVARAGYEAAYTTCGHRDPAHPYLTIPRRMLWENAWTNAFGRPSPAIVECEINGLFDGLARCEAEHGC